MEGASGLTLRVNPATGVSGRILLISFAREDSKLRFSHNLGLEAIGVQGWLSCCADAGSPDSRG